MSAALVAIRTLPLLLLFCPPLIALAQVNSPADLLPVIKGLKYGYINRSGHIVVRPRFDSARHFSAGLARVEINDRFGFIDRTGRIVIKPRFNMAGDFAEGVALVRIPDGTCELCGESVYIDKLGEVVIHTKDLVAARTGRVDDFSEGLASTYIGDTQTQVPNNLPYGYIDKTGKLVIPPKFGYAGAFHEGLALVAKDFLRTAWGYTNRHGEYVIPPTFSNAGDFHEGLAAVQLRGRWGYIDRTGRVVIEPQFDQVLPFSEGLAAVKVNNKYGYLNTTGAMIIPPEFEWAEQFSEGLAPGKRGGRTGYINKEGKFAIVILMRVDEIGGFSGGVARVLVKYKVNYPMKIGYIDTRGRFIWKPRI